VQKNRISERNANLFAFPNERFLESYSNRVQYKIKNTFFVFIAEMQPNFGVAKVSAKNRISERNANLFAFPNERFLESYSNRVQYKNKK